MKNVLIMAQIVFSVLLVGVILLQNKGTGFGRTWGGAASFSRRGLEKLVFRATFVLVAVFLVVSVVLLFI